MQSVQTISSEATLAEVVQLFLRERLSLVLLVESASGFPPIGLLSSQDLAALINRGIDLRKRAIEFCSAVPLPLSGAATREEMQRTLREMHLDLETREALLEGAEEERITEGPPGTSERIFRNIFNSILDGYVLATVEGEIRLVNPSMVRILGYSDPSELIGENITNLVYADPSGRSEMIAILLREGFIKNHEVTVKRKDGQIIYCETNFKLLRNHNGEPVETEGLFRDVTDRKRTLDRLRYSEHRFRELFNNMSSGVAIYRPVDDGNDFVFEDINKAGEGISSVRREEVVGRRLTEAFPSVGDFGLLEILRHVYTTGKPETMPTALYSDASISIWVRNYIYRLESGEVIAVYDDMTKYQEALIDLEKLNSSLELRVMEEVEKRRAQEEILIKQSRIAAMGEVIRNVAHHWRQPLTVLSLIMQNIEEDYTAGTMNMSDVRANVRQSLAIIDGMSRTIDGFRNFFRESHDAIFFDSLESLQETVELLRKELEYNGISIRLDSGEKTKEYLLFGRPNEFKHALLNILSNSRDAIKELEHSGRMRPGDGWITLCLHSLPDGIVEIVVEDNGGGIPDSVIDHVFDPYFSTKFASSGTGMGLYIARTILENDMGASLWIENGKEGARLVMQFSPESSRRMSAVLAG